MDAEEGQVLRFEDLVLSAQKQVLRAQRDVLRPEEQSDEEALWQEQRKTDLSCFVTYSLRVQ